LKPVRELLLVASSANTDVVTLVVVRLYVVAVAALTVAIPAAKVVLKFVLKFMVVAEPKGAPAA